MNAKTILITGSSDGIGLETAKTLHAQGHHVLLHGRNPAKLEPLRQQLGVPSFVADLSRLNEVQVLADAVSAAVDHLDVLINNAGVFQTPDPLTDSGLDVRFVVNTLAPYLLTQKLLPLLGKKGRVVNLSSAAQAPLSQRALTGDIQIQDAFQAYAQSKLALTSWTRMMAEAYPEGPVFLAVNPGSLLGTKMVREGFGTAGKDIRIGSDILIRAALSDEFAEASGSYFDNDQGTFASPHPEAMNPQKGQELMQTMEKVFRSVCDEA